MTIDIDQTQLRRHQNDFERLDPPGHYEARQPVFLQGARADNVFEVLEGTVMISKTLPDGRRQIVEMLGPGSLFGITSSACYPCQADALTAVEVQRIPRREASASRSIQNRWREQLVAELEAVQNHALLLGRKSAIERVASFLLSLPVARPGQGAAASSQASARVTMMTQVEIGDYLGLKVETVSRTLAILMRRMIIAKGKRGHFMVLDLGALSRLASPA